MKKYLATALLLSVLIFTACAQQRKVTRKKTKPVKTSTAGITSVSMSRGACFGHCPTYSLIVNSNGKVEYKGRMFTEHIGVYEKTFPVQQTATMLQAFKDYRVDTCAKEYEQRIADLPGIYYRIMMNGKLQEINNAHFGPAFLKELARQMDEQFPVDNSWKKISDDVPE